MLFRLVFFTTLLAASLQAQSPSEVQELTLQLHRPDPTERRAAAKKLREMGARAKSALFALSIMAKEPDSWNRIEALWSIERIGPTLKEAPLLIELIDKGYKESATVARSLVKIGPSVTPLLIKALETGRLKQKLEITQVVCQLTYSDVPVQLKKVIPVLLLGLKSQDGRIRTRYVTALGCIKAKDEVVTGALFQLLDDEIPDVRSAAAYSLKEIGTKVSPRALAKLSDSKVTGAVAGYWIEKDSPSGIEALRRNLRTAPLGSKQRANAAAALKLLGKDAASAVPELTMALKDPSSTVRKRAIEALGAIAPDDSAAIDGLVLLFDSKSDWEQGAASGALKDIGQPAVGRLIRALQGKSTTLRTNAANTLGKIRPPSKTAVTAVVELLRKSHGMEAMEYCSAVRQMGEAASEAIPVLIDFMLDETDGNRQSSAANTLASLGTAGVPALATTFRKETHNSKRFRATLHAFWQLLRRHPEEIDAVLSDLPGEHRMRLAGELLHNKVETARMYSVIIDGLGEEDSKAAAVDFLEHHRAVPKEAVEGLLQLAKKGNRGAIEALEKTGPAGFNALISLLQSKDSSMQLRAARAALEVDPAKAVPEIIKAAEHIDVHNSRMLAWEIARLSPSSSVDLLRAEQSGNPKQKVFALRALVRITPRTKAVIQALLRALKGSSPEIRTQVLRVFDSGWTSAENAESLIIPLQMYGSVLERILAPAALVKLGRREEVLKVLRHTSKDREAMVKEAACKALKDLGEVC